MWTREGWTIHYFSLKLESIQTKFTRKLCQKLNLKFNSYQDRLNILNLETLETRQLKSDLTIIYKIHNNLIDLNFNEFFTKNNITSTYNLRRHNKYLNKPAKSRTATRRNFFSNRIISIWNRLPESIIDSDSIAIFKNRLDNTNMHNYANLHY